MAEIDSINLVEYSPIDNAISMISNKTKELDGLLKKFKDSEKGNCSMLTMAMSGAIDSPVNGGIQMYCKFPDSDPRKKELISAIKDQSLVLNECLKLHERIVADDMKPFHSSLVSLFDKNFKFI